MYEDDEFTRLKDVMSKVGDKITLTYDIENERWGHTIELLSIREEIVPDEEKIAEGEFPEDKIFPKCVDGARGSHMEERNVLILIYSMPTRKNWRSWGIQSKSFYNTHGKTKMITTFRPSWASSRKTRNIRTSRRKKKLSILLKATALPITTCRLLSVHGHI